MDLNSIYIDPQEKLEQILRCTDDLHAVSISLTDGEKIAHAANDILGAPIPGVIEAARGAMDAIDLRLDIPWERSYVKPVPRYIVSTGAVTLDIALIDIKNIAANYMNVKYLSLPSGELMKLDNKSVQNFFLHELGYHAFDTRSYPPSEVINLPSDTSGIAQEVSWVMGEYAGLPVGSLLVNEHDGKLIIGKKARPGLYVPQSSASDILGNRDYVDIRNGIRMRVSMPTVAIDDEEGIVVDDRFPFKKRTYSLSVQGNILRQDYLQGTGFSYSQQGVKNTDENLAILLGCVPDEVKFRTAHNFNQPEVLNRNEALQRIYDHLNP